MAETKKRTGRPPLDEEERKRRKRERDALERERNKTQLEDRTLAVREKRGLKQFGAENIEPGDNSRYLRHALTTLDMPPIDISDPKQVEERIWWYFGHCIDYDMKPTVVGMCNSLGIHRDTLNQWKNGDRRAGTHQAIVLRAYRMLEELWEDYMLNGKVNPVSGIFLGKSMFGYTDSQEIILTPNQQNQITPEDITTIEAKYAELPDDD